MITVPVLPYDAHMITGRTGTGVGTRVYFGGATGIGTPTWSHSHIRLYDFILRDPLATANRRAFLCFRREKGRVNQ
jgi:hypothetical protein